MQPDAIGFILAAGFGTRLKPFTHYTPKALVPVLDRVLADWALRMLQHAGISRIGINAHHHADQIARYAVENRLTCFAEPAILGTGGYLNNLDGFLDRTMVVINCDAIFPEPGQLIAELVERQREMHVPVTLVLRPRHKESTATGFSVAGNHVWSMDGGDWMFTGMYAATPGVLQEIQGPDIVPVFRKLAAENRLGAVTWQGDWVDGGTPQGLVMLHRLLTDQQNYVYPGAWVAEDAVLERSVVYGNATVNPGARLTDSVVFSGTVSEGEILERCVRV